MTCDICKDDQFPSTKVICVKCAEKLQNDLTLMKAGREQDAHERGLPVGWKRRCNGKLYGLVGVHVMAGKVMVWIYQDGTNNALHIPLSTLASAYSPITGMTMRKESV